MKIDYRELTVIDRIDQAIDQALENMLEKGILLSKTSFHPRSGNPIIKYEVL